MYAGLWIATNATHSRNDAVCCFFAVIYHQAKLNSTIESLQARFYIMDIVSTLQGHTKLHTTFKPQILATKDLSK